VPQLDFITFLCQGGAVFCFSWAFYIFLKSEALPILYRISNFRQRLWIIIEKATHLRKRGSFFNLLLVNNLLSRLFKLIKVYVQFLIFKMNFLTINFKKRFVRYSLPLFSLVKASISYINIKNITKSNFLVTKKFDFVIFLYYSYIKLGLHSRTKNKRILVKEVFTRRLAMDEAVVHNLFTKNVKIKKINEVFYNK
tara:strand:- start:2475 stop:3062 length:588 start_codon:yes stop_codon:yes gene_type:complete